MSQMAKSASAFARAFLAILVLELEDMVVQLVRPPKLVGVHGDRWTVRIRVWHECELPTAFAGKRKTYTHTEFLSSWPHSDIGCARESFLGRVMARQKRVFAKACP